MATCHKQQVGQEKMMRLSPILPNLEANENVFFRFTYNFLLKQLKKVVLFTTRQFSIVSSQFPTQLAFVGCRGQLSTMARLTQDLFPRLLKSSVDHWVQRSRGTPGSLRGKWSRDGKLDCSAHFRHQSKHSSNPFLFSVHDFFHYVQVFLALSLPILVCFFFPVKNQGYGG